MVFDQNALIALIYGLLLLFLVGLGIYLIMRRLRLPTEAESVLEAQIEQGDLSPKIDRSAFIDSYVRTETPRFAMYICGLALVSLLLLPLLTALFYPAVTPFLDAAQTPYYDRTTRIVADMAGGLVQFILIMAVIVALLFATIYLYYKRRPPSHRSVVRKLQEAANER